MKLQPPQLDVDQIDALDSTRDADPAIDAWLGVVSRLMRLPAATRNEIRTELREHLRERTRDLMLSGCDERDAVRTAIEELGETAQLARRFEAANQPPTRRYVMHGLFTIVGAGAIAAGVMTFTNNENASSTASARYETDSAIVADPPASLAATKCSIGSDASLRQALDSIVKQAKVGLSVNWTAIEGGEILVDEPMGLSFNNMPGTQALTLVAEAWGSDIAPLDWRVRHGDVIEFGLKRDLDRSEIELLAYDITATLRMIAGEFAKDADQASEQVLQLLTTMVEPDNWRDNGGDLAHMTLVGGRLFVQAPKRMHGKVQWILDQLPNGEPERRKENANVQGADAPQGVPILSDVPLLSQYFARLEGVSELSKAEDALNQAIREMEMVRTRFKPDSLTYQRAESAVIAASREYDRIRQMQQSKSQSESNDADSGK